MSSGSQPKKWPAWDLTGHEIWIRATLNFFAYSVVSGYSSPWVAYHDSIQLRKALTPTLLFPVNVIDGGAIARDTERKYSEWLLKLLGR